MLRTILTTVLLAVPMVYSAYAEETASERMRLTIEDIERMASERHGSEQTLWGILEELTRQKQLSCMKAFASEAFCACLSEELPTAMSLTGYVAIVTSSKEQLRYSELSPDDQKMIDVTINAREKCVADSL